MKTKGMVGILLLGVLGISGAAAAQESIYLGHISMADVRNDGKDVLIFRESAVSGEPALLNAPLGPGDTVRTTDARRTEIQFDNGTLIRLDFDTELKIETLLAPSLSSLENISNVVLAKGRAYIMYTEYDRRELFQILTPGAALKMKNHTVAEIAAAADGATAVRVSKGRVDVLFGPSPKKTDGEKVRSGESLAVTADGRLDRAAAPAAAEFEAWNASLNEAFEKTHDGQTPLPKPVQKMSKAVFYFAQNYSTTYGQWMWDDYLGYVWRPNENDHRYPWGSWAPYYAGQWARRDGQMFWIPQEPWGWVPFHLGVWHWDKNKGWLWIPGSAFAPAWVAWNFYAGSASWRPWLLWDWYFGGMGLQGWWNDLGFWNFWYGWNGWYGPGWGNCPWLAYYDPGYGPGEPGPNSGRTTLTKITRNQLKGKDVRIVPVPKDLKNAYERLTAAVERGDSRIVESFAALPRDGSVRTSPRLRFETPTRPAASRLSVYPEASEVVLRHSGLTQRLQPRPGGRDSAGAVGFRFRDWNPDVKIAVRQGVAIRYDSRSNEVFCPQRGLTSRVIASRGGDGRRSGDLGESSVSTSSSSSGESAITSSSSGAGSRVVTGQGGSQGHSAATGGTKKD